MYKEAALKCENCVLSRVRSARMISFLFDIKECVCFVCVCVSCLCRQRDRLWIQVCVFLKSAEETENTHGASVLLSAPNPVRPSILDRIVWVFPVYPRVLYKSASSG